MKKFSLIVMLIIAASALNAFAGDNKDNTIQRIPIGVFDMQKNTKGSVSFHASNYGINFLNIKENKGSGFWPRGTENQYIFGAGFWFAAEKRLSSTGDLVKLVEMSYNPNSGNSWFRPGQYYPGIDFTESNNLTKIANNRLYFSTDFDNITGMPLPNVDGGRYSWPLWIQDGEKKYHYGTYLHDYVNDTLKRTTQYYPNGPLYVSDEDIVSTFHDFDLDLYQGGKQAMSQKGYPLGLQVVSSIYTWDEESAKNIVVINYEITNASEDTLFNCYFGKVIDVDIYYSPNSIQGATNDRIRFFEEDNSLNLGVAWTDTDKGEAGKGFGYLGLSFIETPAVDNIGFIRNDKLIYEPEEQIGVNLFKNWSINVDPITENDRYQLLSEKILQSDLGPADQRMLMSCGPFSMRPGDKAHVSVCINFAAPAKGGEADGTIEDIAGLSSKSLINQDNKGSLVDGVKLIKDVYYNKAKITSVASQSEKFSKMRIYPNPASSILSIEGIEDKMLEREYRIISIDGVLISKGKFAGNIDISSLAPGAYYLLIDGVPLRFIKQ